MTSRRRSSRPSGRQMTVRVRTAKGRKKSSTRWLQRQLNDPYVAEAQRQGYRSRAAWKLLQLDDKDKFLKRGERVVDLGAAPGGWTQVAVERVGEAGEDGEPLVTAIDIADMDPVPGAEFLKMDFLEDDGLDALVDRLAGRVGVVLSDMSPATSGHRGTDHLRSMILCEAAFEFAETVLRPGGTLVAKAFEGGASAELMARLKRAFSRVRHVKPPASRPESPEIYIVATGFRPASGDAASKTQME